MFFIYNSAVNIIGSHRTFNVNLFKEKKTVLFTNYVLNIQHSFSNQECHYNKTKVYIMK